MTDCNATVDKRYSDVKNATPSFQVVALRIVFAELSTVVGFEFEEAGRVALYAVTSLTALSLSDEDALLCWKTPGQFEWVI